MPQAELSRAGDGTRGRRRRAAALVALGLVCVATSIGGGVHAGADEPTLFSYSLIAGARGARFAYDDPLQSAQIEGDVPEASGSLITGGLGYGLASVAWPGATFANGGTLLQTLVPQVPPEAGTLLNYPLRAEARTGQEPPSVSNDTVPGVTMRATATPDHVDVAANLSRVEGVAGATLGSVRAVSNLRLEPLLGTASSQIDVTDINIADVVRIASVQSVSKGATDGQKATGDAHTTVSGVTVAGVPATIDERGLTIGTSTNPAHAAINDLAKAVLEQSGITLVLTTPTKQVDGPTGRFTAGSLVVTMPGDGAAVGSMSIGAASTVVTASRTDPAAPLLDDVVPAAPAEDVASRGDVASTEQPDQGPPSLPASDDDATPEPVTLGRSDTTLAAAVGFGGLRPILIALGLFGAGLVALGLRRFTLALVAAADTSVPCPLVDG